STTSRPRTSTKSSARWVTPCRASCLPTTPKSANSSRGKNMPPPATSHTSTSASNRVAVPNRSSPIFRSSEEDRPMPRTGNPKTSRRPKSQALPGMEDRAIKALEDIAHDYADIRDRRMALTTEESRLKQRALALMHQHQRSRYKRNGIEIRVVPGEEKLAV